MRANKDICPFLFFVEFTKDYENEGREEEGSGDSDSQESLFVHPGGHQLLLGTRDPKAHL